MSYTIRHMQDRDIPQALEIDREAFPTQWPHPSYNSFKQELRNRLACYLVVIKPRTPEMNEHANDGKTLWQKFINLFDNDRFFGEEGSQSTKEYIVGIAGFWIMVNEAHITTLATRNSYRRHGIGELLLIQIIEMAEQLKANLVTLEARVSNTQAQALYEKHGFEKVGIRKAYYTDNGEDAVIMTTDSLNSSDFQLHFQNLKQAHRYKWEELYANAKTKVV